MLYVTDTHPFIWHLAEDERLSGDAAEVFRKAERGVAMVVVPTIVLAECMYLAEKHRVKVEFHDVLCKVQAALNYRVYPLDLTVILRAGELVKLREIHDRLIVATAQLLKARLITRDEGIRSSGHVETVW